MAPETALGKRAKCPKCSATLLIPVAILATVVEAPQPKSVRPPTPPVAMTPVPLPPPIPIPEHEPIDVEVVEDEPAPLPPPPAPKLARPVVKREPEPTTPNPAVDANDADILSGLPATPVEAPMPSGSNPFAGFVVPGKADRKKRSDEDDEDDKPRRKRR